ncbi:MAG: hypothetical protein HeimC3_52340 [Candidatus Heimdallarchaeota archaeon LC_3]|nr:MAG: hypothetical protein HeimC3_52340 [Candidatus Heimdallarchaeota archaeon LC_3]
MVLIYPSIGTEKLVSGSDEYPIPVFDTNQTDFTDDELISAVYSNYSRPEGFYSSDLDVSINHIIQPANYIQNYDFNRTNFENKSEICAKNNSEAKSLFEEFFDQKPLLYNLLDDEKFFYSDNHRIHNCQYFDPNGSQFFNFEEIGIFVKRPINPQNFKEFSEYIWSVYLTKLGTFNPLSSISNKTTDTLIHSIYTTGYVFGDYGLYDRISLKIFKFTIKLDTGYTTQIEENIRTINGIYRPGPFDQKTTQFPILPLIFVIILSIFSRKYYKKHQE